MKAGERREDGNSTSAQTATGCFKYLAMYSSSFTRSAANRRMPSASFSVAMGSSLSIHRNVFSFISTSGISLRLGRFGRQLADELALGFLQLPEQFGRDGQEIAARQLDDLTDVAKAAPMTSVL